MRSERACRWTALDAYVDPLKREYGGHAFPQIIRGFERTPAKRDLYRSVLSISTPTITVSRASSTSSPTRTRRLPSNRAEPRTRVIP